MSKKFVSRVVDEKAVGLDACKSSCKEIKHRVPLGPVLGPLLFLL